jgi:hypothetical protein
MHMQRNVIELIDRQEVVLTPLERKTLLFVIIGICVRIGFNLPRM